MMTLLYITLWLLSGFLAAWVGYKYADKQQHDTSRKTVFYVTLFGALPLLYILWELGTDTKFWNKPLFKAKEPK